MRRKGFTLIEVNLAMLVVALGLLAIFSLFPAGLKSCEDATGDTVTGMFAMESLTAMRDHYSTNWSDDFEIPIGAPDSDAEEAR